MKLEYLKSTDGGTILLFSFNKEEYRILIFGNDGFNIDLDFKSRKDAIDTYHDLSALEVITEKVLKDNEFLIPKI